MRAIYETRSDAMRATNTKILTLCAAAWLVMAMFCATDVAAQTTQPATGATTRIIAPGSVENGRLSVAVGKSVVVRTMSPFKRVNIGQPDIADFNLVGDRTILLTAKQARAMQIMVLGGA